MRTVTQAAAARLNITIQKPRKHGKLDILEVELKKDILECMQCRYFYGNSRQCIATECVRKTRQTKPEGDSQCSGCPYRQSESYCFPCIKKILGGFKEEKKDG